MGPTEESAPLAKKFVFFGSCFCGAASFRVEGKPLISVYCHCTICQRLTGGAVVHGLHYPLNAFTWTHDDPEAIFTRGARKESGWEGWRCKYCYTFIAGRNMRQDKWSVRGSHLQRDPRGLIENWELIKPTAHIFYGTRTFDVSDDLPKWEGYEHKSNQLHFEAAELEQNGSGI